MNKRSLVLACTLLALTACGKINQDNYAKLSAGMSKAEVEALLGSASECSGAVGLTSCSWGDDKVMMFSGSGLK